VRRPLGKKLENPPGGKPAREEVAEGTKNIAGDNVYGGNDGARRPTTDYKRRIVKLEGERTPRNEKSKPQ